MRGSALTGGLAGVAFAFCLSLSAHAQAVRTWVSGVGNDANPCSITAPCKTFATAISKTAASGIINCLDAGGFGAVTITKPITIRCSGRNKGGVLASTTNGVTINVANAGAMVTLEDFAIDGNISGVSGVRMINNAAVLHLENVYIDQFQNSGVGEGYGVIIAPTTGVAELYVANSTINDNGGAGGGGGILLAPSGTASVAATLSNVQVLNNRFGVKGDATYASGTTGQIAFSVQDSMIAGNTGSGFSAVSAAGKGAVTAVLSNSTSAYNSSGVTANGPGATVRVGGSTLAGNLGQQFQVQNGGQTRSSGNNTVLGVVGAISGVDPLM